MESNRSLINQLIFLWRTPGARVFVPIVPDRWVSEFAADIAKGLYGLPSLRRSTLRGPSTAARLRLISGGAKGTRARLSLKALVAAAHRGVHVQIFEPTMYHCKVMIVNGLWLSVGSATLDSRSFSLNDAGNLNIADMAFTERQIAIFREDVARTGPPLVAQLPFCVSDTRKLVAQI